MNREEIVSEINSRLEVIHDNYRNGLITTKERNKFIIEMIDDVIAKARDTELNESYESDFEKLKAMVTFDTRVERLLKQLTIEVM